MQSMTGFGTGESTVGALTVTVELRSVNHRFLDVSVKMPSSIAALETEIRAHLKDKLARGRVSCSVQVARAAGADAALITPEAVDRGLDALAVIADRMAVRGLPRPEVGLDNLLALPDLLHGDADDIAIDDARQALAGALAAATDGLLAMKRTEGAELAAEMGRRIETIRVHLAKVNTLTPNAVAEAEERLRERLAALLEDKIDPQRLAQEAAILADRGNIAEECERLASHLDQSAAALAAGGQMAKRLNFLLQEMHREVNTMGSKTQNMEITGAVIAMKEEVESMREQVQNLE